MLISQISQKNSLFAIILDSRYKYESEVCRDVYWEILGQFYADKNHTKISGEYVIKIRCLRSPLSHAHTRDVPLIQKISD